MALPVLVSGVGMLEGQGPPDYCGMSCLSDSLFLKEKKEEKENRL